MTDDAIWAAFQKDLARSWKEMRQASEWLSRLQLSLPEYRAVLLRDIRETQVAAYVLGRTAWQWSDDDSDQLVARLDFQYHHANGFIADIQKRIDQAGVLAEPSNWITARAALYLMATWSTYQAGQHSLHTALGKKEERRVLGPAEHCPDCLESARRGWQPIGTLPAIGDSRCFVFCQCHFEYR